MQPAVRDQQVCPTAYLGMSSAIIRFLSKSSPPLPVPEVIFFSRTSNANPAPNVQGPAKF